MPYSGVLIIRILLLKVLYQGPLNPHVAMSLPAAGVVLSEMASPQGLPLSRLSKHSGFNYEGVYNTEFEQPSLKIMSLAFAARLKPC